MLWFERKKLLIYFTIFHFIGFNIWLFIGSNHDWTKTLGSSIFSILAPLITSITLFLVYKRIKESDKYFWLFISLGCLSYTIWEGIRSYHGTFHIKESSFQGLPDFFYLLQMLIFLTAFIYKIWVAREKLHLIKFGFDTCIIMTVAICFSTHFIIREIIAQNNASGLLVPIGSLVLLFGAASFYISEEKFFPLRVLNIILCGIIVIVCSDSLYFFFNTANQQITDQIVDPLRSVGFLLIGISGTFALEEPPINKLKQKKNRKYSFQECISFRLILPYLSVILLFMVMIFQSSDLNSLKTGTAVAILLVLFRQIFTAIENQTLLSKFHDLTEELEHKIGERTQELSSKNQQLMNAVQKMKHMAFHDVLSGLPNRRLYLARLLKAMGEAENKRHKIAVVFIDLDRFKNINDTLGHEFGDLLLKYVSRQMSQSLRKIDTISRQGGDEFTLILNKISTKADVIPLIEKMQSIVAKPIIIKGQELHVSMSIGIAIYPGDGINTEELMKNADMAMYCAKENGRNNYKFFSKDMNQAISRKMTLENGLRKAISNNEFVLNYQPQVDLHTGEVVGVEALIRWNSMEAGMVPPSEFIPLAEETRLIFPIGEWVLHTACKQAKVWHDSGHGHLKLAVNISPLQFLHDNFVEMIANVLEETGFNPSLLELEITEGMAFYDAEEAIKKMQILRELGVRISIDDFGTGYSSLMYLKRFPINTLKIAHSFIQDITSKQSDKALIEAIVSMAHSLGLKVIAEGAETKEQLLTLKELHCDEVQGDIYGKPLTVMQLEALMESKLNKHMLTR